MFSRAYRRFQLKKKKAKARKLYPWHHNPIKFADHLATCSCPMCGNPRKWNGSRTMQEVKKDVDAKQQIDDVDR